MLTINFLMSHQLSFAQNYNYFSKSHFYAAVTFCDWVLSEHSNDRTKKDESCPGSSILAGGG